MFYDLYDPSHEETKPPRSYRERKTIDNFYKGHEHFHFRFSRETMEMLCDEIGEFLDPTYTNRRTDITAIHQLQIALNFFATGIFY
jgi:hypothetical protein